MSRCVPRPLSPRRALRTSAAAVALTLLAGALACAGGPDAGAPTAPTARAPRRPPAAPAAGETVGATMRFGREEMNGFAHMSPKAFEHTRAGHAMDKVYPGTVSIRAGQTVAFTSFPIHQIAVYGPGTRPEAIRLDPDHLADAETPFGTFPDVLIDDPDNRLAVSPISFQTMTWQPPAGTFAKRGRYLVICTLVFHYVEAKMYGWVEVR
jgi:hypothetical protein